VDRAVIDALAANRGTLLAQVNANLMGSARLQAALHQGVIAEILEDLYVRDRSLTLPGFVRTAAPAVATVIDQVGFDSSRLRPPPDKSEIGSFDGVSAKLLTQVSLGGRIPREDDESASISIEAMNGAHPAGLGTGGPGFLGMRRLLWRTLTASQQSRQEVGKSCRQISLCPAPELSGFSRVPHRRQSGRLVDHDNVLVRVAEDRRVHCRTPVAALSTETLI
jgi:hypothetical protein